MVLLMSTTVLLMLNSFHVPIALYLLILIVLLMSTTVLLMLNSYHVPITLHVDPNGVTHEYHSPNHAD